MHYSAEVNWYDAGEAGFAESVCSRAQELEDEERYLQGMKDQMKQEGEALATLQQQMQKAVAMVVAQTQHQKQAQQVAAFPGEKSEVQPDTPMLSFDDDEALEALAKEVAKHCGARQMWDVWKEMFFRSHDDHMHPWQLREEFCKICTAASDGKLLCDKFQQNASKALEKLLPDTMHAGTDLKEQLAALAADDGEDTKCKLRRVLATVYRAGEVAPARTPAEAAQVPLDRMVQRCSPIYHLREDHLHLERPGATRAEACLHLVVQRESHGMQDVLGMFEIFCDFLEEVLRRKHVRKISNLDTFLHTLARLLRASHCKQSDAVAVTCMKVKSDASLAQALAELGQQWSSAMQPELEGSGISQWNKALGCKQRELDLGQKMLNIKEATAEQIGSLRSQKQRKAWRAELGSIFDASCTMLDDILRDAQSKEIALTERSDLLQQVEQAMQRSLAMTNEASEDMCAAVKEMERALRSLSEQLDFCNPASTHEQESTDGRLSSCSAKDSVWDLCGELQKACRVDTHLQTTREAGLQAMALAATVGVGSGTSGVSPVEDATVGPAEDVSGTPVRDANSQMRSLQLADKMADSAKQLAALLEREGLRWLHSMAEKVYASPKDATSWLVHCASKMATADSVDMVQDANIAWKVALLWKQCAGSYDSFKPVLSQMRDSCVALACLVHCHPFEAVQKMNHGRPDMLPLVFLLTVELLHQAAVETSIAPEQLVPLLRKFEEEVAVKCAPPAPIMHGISRNPAQTKVDEESLCAEASQVLCRSVWRAGRLVLLRSLESTLLCRLRVFAGTQEEAQKQLDKFSQHVPKRAGAALAHVDEYCSRLDSLQRMSGKGPCIRLSQYAHCVDIAGKLGIPRWKDNTLSLPQIQQELIAAVNAVAKRSMLDCSEQFLGDQWDEVPLLTLDAPWNWFEDSKALPLCVDRVLSSAERCKSSLQQHFLRWWVDRPIPKLSGAEERKKLSGCLLALTFLLGNPSPSLSSEDVAAGLEQADHVRQSLEAALGDAIDGQETQAGGAGSFAELQLALALYLSVVHQCYEAWVQRHLQEAFQQARNVDRCRPLLADSQAVPTKQADSCAKLLRAIQSAALEGLPWLSAASRLRLIHAAVHILQTGTVAQRYQRMTRLWDKVRLLMRALVPGVDIPNRVDFQVLSRRLFEHDLKQLPDDVPSVAEEDLLDVRQLFPASSGMQAGQESEYLIELRRPTAAGIDNDRHHLHIRQLSVYDRAGNKLPLVLVSASGLVMAGNIDRATDNDLNTWTHSKYGPNVPFGSEDHWMRFKILGQCTPHTVKVHNCAERRDRLSGSVLSLSTPGGECLCQHVITDPEAQQPEMQWTVPNPLPRWTLSLLCVCVSSAEDGKDSSSWKHGIVLKLAQHVAEMPMVAEDLVAFEQKLLDLIKTETGHHGLFCLEFIRMVVRQRYTSHIAAVATDDAKQLDDLVAELDRKKQVILAAFSSRVENSGLANVERTKNTVALALERLHYSHVQGSLSHAELVAEYTNIETKLKENETKADRAEMVGVVLDYAMKRSNVVARSKKDDPEVSQSVLRKEIATGLRAILDELEAPTCHDLARLAEDMKCQAMKTEHLFLGLHGNQSGDACSSADEISLPALVEQIWLACQPYVDILLTARSALSLVSGVDEITLDQQLSDLPGIDADGLSQAFINSFLEEMKRATSKTETTWEKLQGCLSRLALPVNIIFEPDLQGTVGAFLVMVHMWLEDSSPCDSVSCLRLQQQGEAWREVACLQSQPHLVHEQLQRLKHSLAAERKKQQAARASVLEKTQQLIAEEPDPFASATCVLGFCQSSSTGATPVGLEMLMPKPLLQLPTFVQPVDDSETVELPDGPPEYSTLDVCLQDMLDVANALLQNHDLLPQALPRLRQASTCQSELKSGSAAIEDDVVASLHLIQQLKQCQDALASQWSTCTQSDDREILLELLSMAMEDAREFCLEKLPKLDDMQRTMLKNCDISQLSTAASRCVIKAGFRALCCMARCSENVLEEDRKRLEKTVKQEMSKRGFQKYHEDMKKLDWPAVMEALVDLDDSGSEELEAACDCLSRLVMEVNHAAAKQSKTDDVQSLVDSMMERMKEVNTLKVPLEVLRYRIGQDDTAELVQTAVDRLELTAVSSRSHGATTARLLRQTFEQISHLRTPMLGVRVMQQRQPECWPQELMFCRILQELDSITEIFIPDGQSRIDLKREDLLKAKLDDEQLDEAVKKHIHQVDVARATLKGELLSKVMAVRDAAVKHASVKEHIFLALVRCIGGLQSHADQGFMLSVQAEMSEATELATLPEVLEDKG